MSTLSLRGRVELRPLAGLLAAGDTLALATFVVAGTIQHGSRPLANPGIVLGALAPFLLAWLAVALLGGLFTAEAVRSPGRALRRTVPAWLLAVPLAHALRVTPVFRGGTTVGFFLVSLAVGGLLLIGWRLFAGILLVGWRRSSA
jgi:hypothetical protein